MISGIIMSLEFKNSFKLSEIFGERTLKNDRIQRRKGMVYAAKRTLEKLELRPEFCAFSNFCRDRNSHVFETLKVLGPKFAFLTFGISGFH